MKKQKFGLKNIISLLLAVVLLITTCVSSFSVSDVRAESNDIRQTMIGFFKGNQITDIDKSNLSDPNTLRFLSLFVSNFYVPFSTTLDDEDSNGTKDAIVKALQNQCHFTQDTAETLVELVYQYTLSTAKPLYVNTANVDSCWNYVIGGNGADAADSRGDTCIWDNSKSLSDSDIEDGSHYNCTADKDVKVCSYGVFLELMGQADNAPIYWAEDDASAIASKDDADYIKKHTVWNWNPSGHGSKVDGKMDTSEVSISELDPVISMGLGNLGEDVGSGAFTVSIEGLVSIGSYLLCANNLNYSSGYGNAFMMYTLDMGTIDKLKISDEDVTADDPSSDAWKVCAMTAPLYVDWVGNIIVDTGFCRYIVVPACQNPYTWSSASGTYEAGTFIQGCTLFALAAPNSSLTKKPSLQYYNLPDDSGERHYKYDDSGTVNMGYWVQLSKGSTAKPTLMTVEKWMQYVGSTDNSCDSKVFGKGDGYDLLNAMYANITNTTELDNYMFADDSWLVAWKCDSVARATGYHNSKADAGTSYFGMVTIGKGKDVKSCKGGDGKYVGKIPAFSTFLYVDNLNAYEGTDDDKDKSMIQRADVIKMGSSESGSRFTFGQAGYNKISVGNCDSVNFSWAEEHIENIYLTYLMAYVYAEESTTTDLKIDLKFEKDRFPSETGTIDWNNVGVSQEKTQEEVLSFVYYFLHPSKGVGYIASWVKTKLGGVLLSWHSDIVGGGSSNASTGMTSYLGFSSYTTLPNLYDIEWIANLLNAYNSIIIFLIVIISVILCCYIIVGTMTLQRGIIGVLLFGIVAFLPPVAITSVTDTCNRLSDQILSNKFEYWALVQHQTYLADIYEASQTNDKDLYASVIISSRTTSNNSQADESAAGYSGVKLKWMSPKKENYLAGVANELNDITSNDTLKSLFYNIVSPTLSGQSFVDESDALYLYRDYVDITNYAIKGYNIYNYYYGGRDESNKKVVNYKEGVYAIDTYSKWFEAPLKRPELATFTYSSGLTVREMILRNDETGYTENNYSKSDDLYGCTSIFALRSGFINNPTTISDTDSTSNLSYYKYDETSNLHLNFLLNFTLPYNSYIRNFDRVENLIEGTNDGKINLQRLGSYGGTYLDTGHRTFYGSFGLDPHNFMFSLSDLDKEDGTKYTGSTNFYNIQYFYYGLYSESPYYYFNWLLQDNMNNAGVGYSYDGYKSSYTAKDYVNHVTQMLLADNQSFFYNYDADAGDGYGELKDFMNMHDLFYYVIPILQDGSDLAEYFNKYFDIEMYEDMPLKIAPSGNVRFTDGGSVIEVGPKNYYASDSEDSSDSDGSAVVYSWSEFADVYVKEAGWTDEQIYKFWHNYEVITILEAYTAWTDTMYDCAYADSEKISVGSGTFQVDNPLDPTSYFQLDASGKIVAGRFMVFSRSEMAFYGLTEADLTTVERKIINIQDSVYEDCISLMNYSNFDDDVVLSALAMDMLFAFNKEFSEESLTGEGHVLYPTGYELKAFTYDAYMRLILSEATGEDLMSQTQNSDGLTTSGNIYERILSKTSLFFAIFLVFLDIIVTYVIPLMRLLFLISVFLLSIIVIASEAFKLELNIIKVTWKALLCPLLCFGAISIGLSLINSLFMSNGYEGVVKGSTTISLGDPTMTVIAMLLVNIVVTILYWKVLSTTFKNLKKFATALATNVAGNVVGAVGKVAGGLAAGGVAGAALSRLNGIRSGIKNAGGSGGSGNGGNGNSGNPYSSPEQRGMDKTGGSPKSKTEDKLDAKQSNNKSDNKKKSDNANNYDKTSSSGAAKVGLGAAMGAAGAKALDKAELQESVASNSTNKFTKMRASVGAKKNKFVGNVQTKAGQKIDSLQSGIKNTKDKVVSKGKQLGNATKTTIRNSKPVTAVFGKSGTVGAQSYSKQMKLAEHKRTARRNAEILDKQIRSTRNSSARDAKRAASNAMRKKNTIAKNKATKQKSKNFMRNQGKGGKRNKRK